MDSIREEHRLLKELGAIEKMPSEEMVKLSAEGILQWIREMRRPSRRGWRSTNKRFGILQPGGPETSY